MNRMRIRILLGCAAMMLVSFDAGAAASRQELSQRWLSSGRAQTVAGNHLVARKSLEKAIVADPANALALAWLGVSCQKLGDAEAAAKYFRIALEVEPDNRTVVLMAGKADVSAGEMADAKDKLARLQRLCGAACPETQELDQLIAAGPGK